ncbi:MAG: HK97 family phage prohead protease [Alphaproteobacteria bacterium]|nr:HK97 family phage prohead protease [Alphaproteobacteria bacterium]
MILNYKTLSPIPLILEKSNAMPGFIRGYASVFNHLDHHGDRVQKGAFLASLKAWHTRRRMPKMLWQHEATKPIGQWLKVQEDERGLYVEGKLLLEIQQGREAFTLIQEGVLDSLSIGYRVEEAVVPKGDERGTRHLQKLDLQEISLVTFAANSEASLLKHTSNELNPREAELLLQALQRAKQKLSF